jgi:geranylgeranyl pyrophosphate synthase
LNKHTEDQKEIDLVLNTLKKNKSIDYADKKAKKIVEKAWKGVEKKLPDGEAKKNLEKLSKFLIERKL